MSTYNRIAISSSHYLSMNDPQKYFYFSSECVLSSFCLNSLFKYCKSKRFNLSLRSLGSSLWVISERWWKYFSILSEALRVREWRRWECWGRLSITVVKCVRKALNDDYMFLTSSTFLGSSSRRKVSIDSLPGREPSESSSEYFGKIVRKASWLTWELILIFKLLIATIIVSTPLDH